MIRAWDDQILGVCALNIYLFIAANVFPIIYTGQKTVKSNLSTMRTLESRLKFQAWWQATSHMPSVESPQVPMNSTWGKGHGKEERVKPSLRTRVG